LPKSITLRDVLPCLADPLATPHLKIDKMRARVRLSYGWHMLNQARIALVEAEACTVFYEEYRRDHVEALYRCQYYLDDAALRLHSACEHLLRSVVLHWTIELPYKGPSTPESRDSLLRRVLRAAKQSKDGQVRVDITKLLDKLRSSKEWNACMQHRNDWVHNRLPAIAGLFLDIQFKAFDYEKELPLAILKDLGLERKRGVAIRVGKGKDIKILRETVRSAYGELFRVYEGLARMLSKDSRVVAR
jgi:hypothetical protein